MLFLVLIVCYGKDIYYFCTKMDKIYNLTWIFFKYVDNLLKKL